MEQLNEKKKFVADGEKRKFAQCLNSTALQTPLFRSAVQPAQQQTDLSAFALHTNEIPSIYYVNCEKRISLQLSLVSCVLLHLMQGPRDYRAEAVIYMRIANARWYQRRGRCIVSFSLACEKRNKIFLIWWPCLLRERKTPRDVYTPPFALIPFVAVDFNLKWTGCAPLREKYNAPARRVSVVVSQFYLTTAKTASATFIRITRSYP